MFLTCETNNGKLYLRLKESSRDVLSNGKKGPSKTKVILNLGPLEKFDDGKPNYFERLKDSFKRGEPLIDILKDYCSEKKDKNAEEIHHILFRDNLNVSNIENKIFGHKIIEAILEQLKLDFFFSRIKTDSKMTYDLWGYIKLIVFGRLLNPASLQKTLLQNNKYYVPVLDITNSDNIYDVLDVVYANRHKLLQRISTSLSNMYKDRDLTTLYYDTTNFYFEIDDPDEDEFDEDGQLIAKGLRKPGVSKENRKEPLVQMSLFMDNTGLPIATKIFSGNTLDHLTLKESLEESINNLDLKKFILVSDRGIFNYKNASLLLNKGNGYIMAKSLAKSLSKERAWATDDKDFIHVSKDFKYKERIIKKKITTYDDVDMEITEKVVIYWSKKFYDKARKENQRFFEFLEKLKDNPANFRITALDNKIIRKFLKKDALNVKTGEFVSLNELKGQIDEEKVEAFKKQLGYYQLVTSEIHMPAEEVIEKYHGLTQIETQFRAFKNSLNIRPVFLQTMQHIEAHTVLCLLSLLSLRILQKRILTVTNVPEDKIWSEGLSASRIQAALNAFTIGEINSASNRRYTFTCLDDNVQEIRDLKLILSAFDFELKSNVYTLQETKSIKNKFKNLP